MAVVPVFAPKGVAVVVVLVVTPARFRVGAVKTEMPVCARAAALPSVVFLKVRAQSVSEPTTTRKARRVRALVGRAPPI